MSVTSRAGGIPEANFLKEKPGGGYREILRQDRHPPSPDLYDDTRPDLGVADTDSSIYTSAAFHRLEVERMWSRVWQLACREEEISEVGDVVVYDLADHSFLITRSAENEIKAFYNSCLHRGVKLCSPDTNVSRFRCPFHGWTWSLDGRIEHIPCQWDFPQVGAESGRLPEIRVARWAGFVFVNMDPAAPPLEEYLEDIPKHLETTDYGGKYISGYYRKIVACNWKVAMEAFCETYHVLETHAHAAIMSDDLHTQYDIYPGRRHTNRYLQPLGVRNSFRAPISEQELLNEIFRITHQGEAPTLPEGMPARAFLAENVRKHMGGEAGIDLSHISDAEAVDSLEYALFPNIVFFRGIAQPEFFRFRPNGNDPDSCIFDLFYLKHCPEGRPRPHPAECQDIGERSWQEASPMPKWLGYVFDQDTANLELQQVGMKAAKQKILRFGRYQEVRIRHLHKTLEEYIRGE